MVASPAIDALETAWRSLDGLCAELSDAEWARATDLPGWTVKDVVAHICGVESMLLGHSLPDHDATAPYVKNDLGAVNEIQVDYRRPRAPAAVLDEFRSLTAERLGVLRSLNEADLDAPTWTPTGPGTVGQLLELRVVDTWVHEQDIRRAVGRPGHLDGPVPQMTFDSLMKGMPYVVGKRAAAPDGATLVFDVDGRGRRAIHVQDGWAKAIDASQHPADATLTMDLETFCCLATGRWSARDATDRGRVKVSGDAVLAQSVLENMNVAL